MTDSEAFEAWKNRPVRLAGEYVPMWQTWGPGEERIALEAWQAALASERAKQAEPVANLHDNKTAVTEPHPMLSATG